MWRFLTVSFCLIGLSACVTNNPDAPRTLAPVDDRSISSQPANAAQSYDATGNSIRYGRIASSNLDNLNAGSQEELVAAVGDRVFFDFNSQSINAAGKQTLERQAEWLKINSTVNVTIEGHADERGTREYNLALGERRAFAAKQYLEKLGVEASRINTISYGKEHPEYLSSDEAAWSKNRRAVTVVNY